MDTSEADDEADDSGALAAVGCLRAISTILESVSRLPHLFVQIEPILLPIMRRMLTTDGQGTTSTSRMHITDVTDQICAMNTSSSYAWYHYYQAEQKIHAL